MPGDVQRSSDCAALFPSANLGKKEYLPQVANLADEIAHYSRAKSASKPASVLARSGCTVPCDHLAGMTDRSVMREYQRLIGTDV